MNSTESIKELSKALSLAQKEIDEAKKETVNPFFKKNYADLSSVWSACREHLTKHGLSVVQLPGNDGDKMTLETVLMHESGQWISSVCAMKPVKNDPQGCGSCLTYLRRYALSAVVGVCSTEVDDDGNAASEPGKSNDSKKEKEEVAKKPLSKPQRKSESDHQTSQAGSTEKTITEAQKKLIYVKLGQSEIVGEDDLKQTFCVDHLPELKMSQMNEVLSYIQTGAVEGERQPGEEVPF